MSFASAVLYVHAATPVRIYFRVALAVVLLFGVWLAATGNGSDTALVCLLVIQMFAVSTGFRAHATRGHYDPLLTRLPRWMLALAHAASASSPGALAWIGIAMAQVASARSVRVLALSPASLTAFFLVSIVAWSISVPLGPLTGGSLWLAAAVAAVLNGGAMKLFGLVRTGADTSFPVRLLVAMAFPPFLVSSSFGRAELSALLAIGTLFLLSACAYVGGSSFPLREEGT
jgi:hypothetical protein